MEVRHDADASRYELVADDRVLGVVDYQDRGGVLVFFHTEVDPDLQGAGLGSTLVRGALDDVRRAGRTILPQCPFVAHFLDDYPEYGDLVAG